ncbi:MAG: RIP metalloprotease RseP, partial [Candidatus Adiutrix sp.]|nr:RIP metalloprotease RseP [Candidatus Adiutrix sp.]
LKLTVVRQGLEENFTVNPIRVDSKDLFGDAVTYYDPGFSHRMKPVIAKVAPGQPAEEAGLEAGDVILFIGGRPTPDWQDVLMAIQGPPEERDSTTPKAVRPLVFEVERQGRTMTLEVTPKLNPGFNTDGDTTFTPMVGMESRPEVLTEKVGLIRAAGMGIEEAGRMIGLTLLSVQKLLSGQVSAKTLGGPILIAEVAGDRARAGLTPFLNLAAFISINLGILNLLPIPMLDGGQLVFFLLEAIRRKPLSSRFREIAQWTGAALLGLLMVTVFYNDIARLVTRMRTKTEVQTIETTAPARPAPPVAADTP